MDQPVKNVIPAVDLDISPECVLKLWVLEVEVDSEVEADSGDSELDLELLLMLMGLRSNACEFCLPFLVNVLFDVCDWSPVDVIPWWMSDIGEGHADEVRFSRCNGENHLARDCLAPRDEAAALAAKKCYKCQETGHIARSVQLLNTCWKTSQIADILAQQGLYQGDR